jgi:hypothetical protein
MSTKTNQTFKQEILNSVLSRTPPALLNEGLGGFVYAKHVKVTVHGEDFDVRFLP